MRDFKFQKTKVKEMVLNQGHILMFIPKFHCELNPIERVWCYANTILAVTVITCLLI